MKKLLATLLSAVLLLSLAACAGAKTQETSDTIAPLDLLNTVWDSYAEDEKFFAIGGDFSEENTKENAPGTYTMEDASELDRVLGYPAAEISKIEAAASLTHMMNANTFTAGAYQVRRGEDIDALARQLEANILSRQWICGFPDKVLVAYVGGCLIGAFGAEELIDNFRTHLGECYSNVVIVSEAPVE